MAEFPTTPVPKFPITVKQVWNTIVTPFDSGTEQRRQKQAFPKYDIELLFDILSKTEFAALWNFYTARRGSYEAFYFYTIPATEDFDGLYVDVGNGSTTIFDLPGKSTSAQSIYLDNVLQTTGYSILTGGGAENADRVSFTSAPTAGQVITCDFTGYQRIHCRFESDEIAKEMFSVQLYRTGLKLKGVFP